MTTVHDDTEVPHGRCGPDSQVDSGGDIARARRGDGAVTGIGAHAGDVRVSAVAWIPSPDMDESRWLAYGKQIGRAGNGTSWWIGDWLRFGFGRFGEKYTLAARITGYDEQTLMNYAYVASRIPVPQRHPQVSWSHHAEVAKLDRDAQARWLERVADDRLSVKELRRALRSGRLRQSGQGLPVPDAGDEDVCPTCRRPLAVASGDSALHDAPEALAS